MSEIDQLANILIKGVNDSYIEFSDKFTAMICKLIERQNKIEELLNLMNEEIDAIKNKGENL